MKRYALSCVIGLLVVLSALQGTAVSTSTEQAMSQSPDLSLQDLAPPSELCAVDDYADYAQVKEFPKGWGSWIVQPMASANESRVLYLLNITLTPGQCIPFKSEANQKDGAVLLIVQQGNIAFVAEPHPAEPDAVVEHGALDALGTGTSSQIDFGAEVEVKPDEWVSQNAQVWFTFWNTSDSEDAELWKVVWSPPMLSDGCGGDCK